MNVYGHLFEGAQGELTQDLDALLMRTRPAAIRTNSVLADGEEVERES